MSFSPPLENSLKARVSSICMNLDGQFKSLQENSTNDCMCVYARIRPMLAHEEVAGYKECITATDDKTVRAVMPSSFSKYKNSNQAQEVIEDFMFSTTFGPETGQFVFFQETMMNTMQNFVEGGNSLIFSFGITGSGKTYTLQGDTENPGLVPISLKLFFSSVENQLLNDIIIKPSKFSDVVLLSHKEREAELRLKEYLLSLCDPEDSTFFRTSNSSAKPFAMLLCDLFSDKCEFEQRQTTLSPEEMMSAQATAQMKEIIKSSVENQPGVCSIWVSFLEIYNEYIYDLLQPNISQRSRLNIGEDKNGDVYVKGLREICVSDSDEALKLLYLGQKNLRIASTKLNYQSSRSHCIYTLRVVRIPDTKNMSCARVNRLSFCDLAGSERTAKAETSGLHLKEASCINTSLLVLGRCLEALRQKQTLKDKKCVPFRESKLTRLFSGFFLGKGKAVMIANASPSDYTYYETLHVLRFCAVAREVMVNDSYLSNASSTLQSLTTHWANSKSNTSNLYQSDHSISFDDSFDDILQEKDEIIQNLLDLAESLKKNLEEMKKESAEMEIKIRQEVSREFSEYSDQLIANQQQIFAEERETIKEIHKRRIEEMEARYEYFKSQYKQQSEESGSDDSVSELSKSSGKSFNMLNMENDEDVSSNATKLEKEKEVDEMKHELDVVNSKMQSILQNFEICKNEKLLLEETNTNYEKEILKLQEEKRQLEEVISTVNEENATLKAKIAELEQNVVSAETCNSNLKKTVYSLEEIIEVFKTEKAESEKNHQKALDVFQNDFLVTKEKLDIVNSKLGEAFESIKTYENEKIALEEKNNELKATVLELQEQNKSYELSAKSMDSQLETFIDERSAFDMKMEKLQKCLTNCESENSILKSEIAQLEEKSSLIKSKDSLSADFENCKAERDLLNVKIKDLEQNLISCEVEMNALAVENSSLKDEVMKLPEEKNIEKSDKCVSADFESLKEEKVSLNFKMIDLEQSLTTFEIQKNELVAETSFLKSDVAKLSKEISKLKASNDSLSAEFEACKSAEVELNMKLIKIQEDMTKCENQKNALAEENDFLKSDISKLSSETKSLTTSIDTISAEFVASKAKNLDLEKKVSEADTCIQNLERTIKSLRRDISTLNDQKLHIEEECKKSLETFKEANDSTYDLIEVLEVCEVKREKNSKSLKKQLQNEKEILKELQKQLEDKDDMLKDLQGKNLTLQDIEKANILCHNLILLLEHCEMKSTSKIKKLLQFLKQKDTIIQTLEQQLQEKTNFSTLLQEKDEKINFVEKDNNRLQLLVEGLKKDVVNLTCSIKNSEKLLQDRDASVNDLETALFQSQDKFNNLQKEYEQLKKLGISGNENAIKSVKKSELKEKNEGKPAEKNGPQMKNERKTQRPLRQRQIPRAVTKQVISSSSEDLDLRTDSPPRRRIKKRESDQDFEESIKGKPKRKKLQDENAKQPGRKTSKQNLKTVPIQQSPVKKLASYVGSRFKDVAQSLASPRVTRQRKKLFNPETHH